METIKFIQEKGWNALTEELAIDVKQTDNLFVLNYSQIDSPKTHPVVQECRGLILDEKMNVLCRPFDRFLNYGEGDTKNFDFSDVTVYEKADGSLVKVYWNPYRDQWEAATRGSAYGEVNHCFGTKTDWTFHEAILDAMMFDEYAFQECCTGALHRGVTYLFEYISPYNRIVTPYTKPMVVLTGIRSNATGSESGLFGLMATANMLHKRGMNVRLPQTYKASSADEIVKMAESLSNLQEGFVVMCNRTHKRVKVKSSTYCAVHHLRGNGTPSRDRLMEVVLKNEQDELLAYFPEFDVFIDPIVDNLEYMLSQAEGMYKIYETLPDQKQFAMAVKQDLTAPILFKARKEKVNVRQAFSSMDIHQQMKLLEKFL